jgi:TP901 family phage tail tape measure protein
MAGSADIRAGRAFVELYLSDNRFTRGLAVAEKTIKDWGGKVGNALSKIPKDLGTTIAAVGTKMMGIGAALAVPLGASVKAFASVQTELAKLQAAANPTAAEMAKIRAAVNDISKATGQGPANVTAAFTELIKAGTDVNTALGGAAETVVKFAKVSGMSTADAAIIASDAIHVFAKEGITAAQAVDILAQAADASSIDLQQIALSFSMASAVAGATGVSLRDLAAAVAIMGNAGLKGSDAGTALKTMLMRLAAPTDEAARAMAQYGFDARNAEGNVKNLREIILEMQETLGGLDSENRDNALREIFGTDAIRPALILMQQGVSGWDRFTSAMNSANGVAEKFDILMNTTAGSLERMWAAVQRAGAAVGEALAGPLTQFSEWIAKTAGAIGEWTSQHQGAVVIVAKLAAGLVALGVAGKVLGPLVTMLRGVSIAVAAIAASPFAAPLGIIAAVDGLMAALFPYNAVLTALSWSHLKATDAMKDYSSSSKDLTVATKAEHEAMVAKLQRLEELRSKQDATAAEMEEAAAIAADLADRYPNLAEAIGQVGTAAGAAEKALDGMNKALQESLAEDAKLTKIAGLQDELAAARKEAIAGDAAEGRIDKLGGENAARKRAAQLRGEAMRYARSDPQRSARAIKQAVQIDKDLGLTTGEGAERSAAARRRVDELQNQIDDLNAPGTTEQAGGSGGPRTPSALEDRAAKAARDAAIDAAPDSFAKTLAQINAKYDDMLKEAKTAEDKWAIELARMSEIDTANKKRTAAILKQAEQAEQAATISMIDNEHQREIAEIRAKYAEQLKNAASAEERAALEAAMNREIAASDRAYGKQQEEESRNIDDEIAKAEIEATTTGRQRELALLEIERIAALREASKAGADTDKVNKLFNLRRQLLDRSTTADIFGRLSSGTFSAQAAAMMGRSNAQERTAKATEETAKNTRRIAEKKDAEPVMQ